MKDKFPQINEFIKLCLNIACIVDNDPLYFDKSGLGERVLSNKLREGVKLCIDLQGAYIQKEACLEYEKLKKEQTKNFLKACFGVEDIRDIDTSNIRFEIKDR